MATDRFIHFGVERPTQTEVQMVLEDYFGPIAKVEWRKQGARWYITLEGLQSFALQRVGPVHPEPLKDRGIEVVLQDDTIDIITRHADEATSALANGLGRIFVRRWNGQLE